MGKVMVRNIAHSWSSGGLAMSKAPAVIASLRKNILGQRPPPNNIWTKLAQGQISRQELRKMDWYYMPSLKKLRCPLYADSKEENNEARTERLQRRVKGSVQSVHECNVSVCHGSCDGALVMATTHQLVLSDISLHTHCTKVLLSWYRA